MEGGRGIARKWLAGCDDDGRAKLESAPLGCLVRELWHRKVLLG